MKTALPEIIIDQRAAMKFCGGTCYEGVAAKVLIGGALFTSELPIGAGHAESINRDLEQLERATA